VTSLLTDAFEHHAWATRRLLDTCLALTPEQLATTVPGTFGSIVQTMRHLVSADASYLALLNGDRSLEIEEEGSELGDLPTAADRIAAGWTAVLEQRLDPTAVVVRHRDDGSEAHAPLGIRLAQVVHHGTDHRSQVCTALTTLGIEPPEIDVWSFARAHDRFREVPPPA
jgi:uncharacterized damage-inducible protein DinB